MLEYVHDAQAESAHGSGGGSFHKQHHLVVVDNLRITSTTVARNLVDKLQNLFGVLVFHFALGLEIVIGLIQTLR